MKLHYKGAYDLNPDSLPHGAHKPNAKRFKEAETTKQLSIIANTGCILLIVMLAIPAWIRCRAYLDFWQPMIGCLVSQLLLFPHELLHAICFKEVYRDVAAAQYSIWFYTLCAGDDLPKLRISRRPGSILHWNGIWRLLQRL